MSLLHLPANSARGVGHFALFVAEFIRAIRRHGVPWSARCKGALRTDHVQTRSERFTYGAEDVHETRFT